MQPARCLLRAGSHIAGSPTVAFTGMPRSLQRCSRCSAMSMQSSLSCSRVSLSFLWLSAVGMSQRCTCCCSYGCTELCSTAQLAMLAIRSTLAAASGAANHLAAPHAHGMSGTAVPIGPQITFTSLQAFRHINLYMLPLCVKNALQVASIAAINDLTDMLALTRPGLPACLTGSFRPSSLLPPHMAFPGVLPSQVPPQPTA